MTPHTPAPDALPPSLPAPDTGPTAAMDNYRLGKPLARGGMGSVLEAEDEKLKRTVAVKVMLFDAEADPALRQRFLREAEVLAMLAHPNIVPIHDIVWENGQPLFYTMKLIHGRTLQAVLDDLRSGNQDALREWTIGRLLQIFRKVCDAVAFAHSKNVLHRDLKPENVMVGEFGEVLVMDWGLAKVLGVEEPAAESFAAVPAQRPTLDAQFGNTIQGTVMGTPQYMSPEQAKGQIDTLDERSDIFSLGGILYALLTLRPPVEGGSVAEVLRKVSSAEISPPTRTPIPTGNRDASQPGDPAAPPHKAPARTAVGRVPPALAAVAMKALSLEQSRRYQHVTELAADIEAYQNGFSTAAEQAGLGRQLALLLHRHKGIFSTAAAAWLLIVGLAVWFIVNLRSKEQRASAGEASAKAAEGVAVQEKESARRSLAKAQVNLADAFLRETHGPDMQAALRKVPEDLRDSTWRYLFEASDTSIARLNPGKVPIANTVPHPRLPGIFVVSDPQQKISLLEARTGARQLEFAPAFSSPGRGPCCLAISPDGERIAVGRRSGAGIAIHSAKDGTKLAEWPSPGSDRLEFSPDGKLFLQTDAAHTRMVLRDASSGEQRWEYAPPSNNAAVVCAFTPEGDRVLTFSNADGFQLHKVDDGAVLKSFVSRYPATTSLAMGRDGMAAAADWNGFVHIIDLRAGAISFHFRASEMGIAGIVFTPSGREVMTIAEELDGRQSIPVWDLYTGQRRSALLGGMGPCDGRFGLHPLSGELLVGGTEIRVWNMASATPVWKPVADAYGTSRPVFWGADDIIFGNGKGLRFGVHQLRPGDVAELWKAPLQTHGYGDVSADGKYAGVAWFGDEHRFMLLQNPGPKPEELASFKITNFPSDVRISPAGDRIVVFERMKRTIEVRDTHSGQAIPFDMPDVKRVWMAAWLHGGQWLGGLTTVHAERGNLGSEERIIIWDGATGHILRNIPAPTRLEAIAASPDGRRSAEGGADKMVRIRDAATLKILQEFRAHDGAVTAIAWHPSRPIVATGSADLTIRLWDLETGKRLEELHWLRNAVTGLCFSPSGRRLVSDNTSIWEPPSLNVPPAAK